MENFILCAVPFIGNWETRVLKLSKRNRDNKLFLDKNAKLIFLC